MQTSTSLQKSICAVAQPVAGAARSVRLVEPVNVCEQSPGQSIAPAGSLVTRPWPCMTIVALPASACGSEPAAGSAHANSATSATQASLRRPRPGGDRGRRCRSDCPLVPSGPSSSRFPSVTGTLGSVNDGSDALKDPAWRYSRAGKAFRIHSRCSQKYHSCDDWRVARQERLTDTEEALRPLTSPAPNQLEKLQKEKAGLVWRVLREMRNKRDIQVLLRYHLAEDAKEQICADLGLTSLQFNLVLHRARERYRQLYEQVMRDKQ